MGDLIKIKIQKVIIPYYQFKRPSKLTFSKFYENYYSIYKGGKEINYLNYQPKDYNFISKPLQEDFKGLAFLLNNGNFYLIGGWQNFKYKNFEELEKQWRETYNINGCLNKEADTIFNFFNLNFNKDFFKKTIGLSDVNLLKILQYFSVKFKERQPFTINLNCSNILCRKCNIIVGSNQVVDYKLLEPDFYIHYKINHLI